jgi:hypothetical protein
MPDNKPEETQKEQVEQASTELTPEQLDYVAGGTGGTTTVPKAPLGPTPTG